MTLDFLALTISDIAWPFFVDVDEICCLTLTITINKKEKYTL